MQAPWLVYFGVIACFFLWGLAALLYQTAWMGLLIPDARTTWSLALFAVAVMLLATIFIGATLPLSMRVLARDES